MAAQSLVAIAACYSSVHDLQSWVVSRVEVNSEHATIQPPAVHIAWEIWEMSVYGVVNDAVGYEMVPPWGRRYDPLTRHSGSDLRRYAARCTQEQIRTLRQLCERHMVHVPYDFVALYAAWAYEHAHPRKVGRWETATVAAFDCCAAFTAIGRMAGVPVLMDWMVSHPPMILPPRVSTPASVETWLSRHADPFEHAIGA